MTSLSRLVARRTPHLVVTLIVLFVAIPMLWVVMASLRQGQVLTGDFFDFSNLGLAAYERALQSTLPINLMNSFIACGFASILAVLAGTITAYGFSRFRFRGAKVLFWALLLLQLIPAATLVVPLYKLWGDLRLFNNLIGLGFAYAGISVAVCVLLVKSFIDEIPRELDEAAALDGCSKWSIFWRVILPLLGPPMAASGIFVFVTTWQEFVIASSLLNDPQLYTITVGLQSFRGQFTTDTGAILAGAVITALPVLVIFSVFQKYFVQSMAGGLK